MNATLGKLAGGLFAAMVMSLMLWITAAALRSAWDELTRPSVCYTTMTEQENLR